MKIESFFTIGKRHSEEGLPCEDYALSEKIQDKFFGAVSDGCSGANAKTDIGARLWSLSALNVIEENIFNGNELLPDNFTSLLIEDFKENRITRNNQDEIASLIVLIADNKNAKIWLMGDGGYALKHNNGDVTLYYYKWVDNAPLYPAYLLEPNFFKNLGKRNNMKDVAFTLTKTRFSFNTNNKLIIKEHTCDTHGWDKMKNGLVINIDKENQDISEIAIITDGLWSFNNITPFMVIDFCLDIEKNEILRKHIVDVISYFNEHGATNKDDFSIVKFDWN